MGVTVTWTEMAVPEDSAGYGLIVVMPDAGNSWYVNWVPSIREDFK